MLRRLLLGTALSCALAASVGAQPLLTLGAGPGASGTGVVTPTYVASAQTDVGTTCSGGTCSTVGNIGSAWANNDLIVAVYNGASSTITTATAAIASGTMTDATPGTQISCGPYNYKVFYKKLVGVTDVNSSITVTFGNNNDPVTWYIVHGPNSIAVRNQQCGTAGNATVTLTGYTPAGNAAGALVFAGSYASQATPTSVTSFSTRISNAVSPNNSFFHVSFFDWFSYAGGGVTLTPFGTSGSPVPVGIAIEALN